MTKRAKNESKLTLKQRMINWVKATGKDGFCEVGMRKYYAGIRGNVVRVQEYNDCDELLNDYCIAL